VSTPEEVPIFPSTAGWSGGEEQLQVVDPDEYQPVLTAPRPSWWRRFLRAVWWVLAGR